MQFYETFRSVLEVEMENTAMKIIIINYSPIAIITRSNELFLDDR